MLHPENIAPYEYLVENLGAQRPALKQRLDAPFQQRFEFDHITTPKSVASHVLLVVAELREHWTEDAATEIVRRIGEAGADFPIPWEGLARWMTKHRNNVEAVADCMAVVPPPKARILERLPSQGAQKKAFKAVWIGPELMGPPSSPLPEGALVALKVPLDVNLEKEGLAHRLNIRHPNIVNVSVEQNGRGDRFIVEEWLDLTLEDSWKSVGLEQTVTLMHDIAQGLQYLHEYKGIVHLDVKPDNIGMRGDRFVLFDFGVARSIKEYASEPVATGSLRTRAPEVLCGDEAIDPRAVDVWALGATVYRAETGDYPLLAPADLPPSHSPRGRAVLEEQLAERSRDLATWVRRHVFSDPRLANVMEWVLLAPPTGRPTASELVNELRHSCAAFIKQVDDPQASSLEAEIEELHLEVPVARIGDLLPPPDIDRLRSRISELSAVESRFADTYRRKLRELRTRVGG